MITAIHKFVSGKPAPADPTQFGGPEWDDGHKFTGGVNGAFLYRDTSDPNYGSNWLTPGAAGAILVGAGTSTVPAWTTTPTLASLALTAALAATSGGTGQSSYTVGDILYASTTTALSKLAAVADGNVLRSSTVGGAPLWGKVRLSGSPTDITGTLAPVNGGLGLTTPYTVGALFYPSTTSVISALSPGTSGQALVTGGAGVAPAWGTLPPVGGGTGVTTPLTVGAMLYASSTTTWSQLSPAASGFVLQTRGNGAAPVWANLTDAIVPGNLTIPLTYTIPIPNAASADYNTTIGAGLRVIDVIVVKQAANGNSSEDSVTVKNGTNAISNAIALGNDQTIARATTLDDANWDIADSGTLRITTVRGSGGGNNTECTVYVVCLRRGNQLIPGAGSLTLTGVAPTRTP